MIKKNDESGNSQPRNVQTFKKFSEFTQDTSGSRNILPQDDFDRPANPNIPTTSSKVEKPMSTDYMMPSGQEPGEFEDYDDDIDDDEDVEEDTDPHPTQSQIPTPTPTSKTEKANEVKFYGRVAKLPKGTKASKGFNFLENVKVSKSSIWYIMVEKQDNELQMVKYNHKKGVDLNQFVNELKTYYKAKYSSSPKIMKMIESISIDGNDKYSWIKNIPLIEIDGRKMISKITEDLIKLLSK